jgi:hypothetical protein
MSNGETGALLPFSTRMKRARRRAAAWPAYMSAETLAAALDVDVGYVRQLVKRGLLPQPVHIGEAPRWRFEDVEENLLRQTNVHAELNDPYLQGVERVAAQKARDPSSAVRAQGDGEGQDVRVPVERSRH